MGMPRMAYSTFFSTVVTIIRLQRPMFVCYGFCAALAYALSGFFVKTSGVMGAVIMYGAIMTILSVMLGVIMVWGIARKK